MFEAFSKAQWRRTGALLVACAVLAAVAGALGISDNPPGMSLAFLSSIALVLAFVHPWRTPRRFLLLVGASVAVFVAIVVVGGLLDNAGVGISVVGNAAFLVAILLCPAGFVVGIIGAMVAWVTSRRARHVPPAKPVT